ncbi:monovalent cation/H+ antiporter subunit A [Lysobacter daejeonensis GH1-9]|uniref:Monovalent cation/H+ antiporter subunit A n=1 Tax=Lysobacter daejeonensis GH1-9 TaxID=1385517 RepID=A0A0A0EVW0_9GAMM|nr:monovalent cation/H+ antiporter subunit A [Lysobacter daejeonensis]KGM55086.1 monovalent cation/H+ antiporter subunit A [Lysobacter daejeonensis GH1-9]
MLVLLLALPFIVATWLLLDRSTTLRRSAWMAASAPLASTLLLLAQAPAVFGGDVPGVSYPWLPQIGLDFSLRLDGLAWMFALMVLAIGVLVVMYARYYMGEEEDAPRFFGYLLLFMGAMLGMVLAGNLLLLAIFWELTSITSFLLIGFWGGQKEAREGARMALTITGAGGLALLGGVILIGQVVGSYELDAVLAASDAIRTHPHYPAILALVLAGIFTKSAQFPFHFWLPHAMSAPTPVSAYLHSATMVKAGVFLLARLHPVLAGTDLFFYVVSTVGAATLLVGAWNAIFQHDLKGLLAYSTISHLGLITLLFGLSTPLAVVAGLFHILNHATFKASLFMAAGIIDHEAGTRDMRRLGNLRHFLPVTSALAITAALAMAGIPLLNGFLSKEMFFAQALEVQGHDTMRVAMTLVAFLAGAFGVAYSLRFVHDTFFGSGPRAVAGDVHEPPRFMRIPVGVLVALCLAVGIVPAWTVAPVLATAAHGVLGDRVPEYSLAIWHGFNLPLLMSLGGVLGGGLLYLGLRRLIDLHAVARYALGRHLFRVNTRALLTTARRVTLHVTDGSVQRSLWWVLVAVVAVSAGPVAATLAGAASAASQPMPLLGWGLWAILVGGTLATVALHRQRLLALLVVGAVGLSVSLTFVFLSAPDLALTQLLVEMVTIALMLLALNYLPQTSVKTNLRARRWRDGAIALVSGLAVGGLVYAMTTRPLDTVAGELLARSLPEGYGRNVVNVILVDFRGFDTLGEITVFGIAGLVVHALLRRVRLAAEEVLPGGPQPLPMPAHLSHLLFPLALAVSVYLFLRGHNAPGGGFIAGLVLAIPLLLQYVLQGSNFVESRLGFDYVRCIGAGLLVALATAVAPMLLGYPLLTSGHAEPSLPLVGKLPLTSAMGFDTGVYLAVFGGAMLILSMMGTIKPPADTETQSPSDRESD